VLASHQLALYDQRMHAAEAVVPVLVGEDAVEGVVQQVPDRGPFRPGQMGALCWVRITAPSSAAAGSRSLAIVTALLSQWRA